MSSMVSVTRLTHCIMPSRRIIRGLNAGVWSGLLFLVIVGVGLHAPDRVSLPIQLAYYGAAVLSCCMVCNGELALRKPAPNRLTAFYLMVALGGALGTLLIEASRSFDGTLHVREVDIGVEEPVTVRSLWNGRILHGAQLSRADLSQRPIC